ncbi:hypothetical protein M9Q43_06015 [Flavobacterium sp. HXWNR29]|uniref:hypothetical protein n=1 Tax=Flavobacterium odoriferum TaxID=2946604 RepID=UPI0021CB9774|nr:hypothetical protein [Flavobacterium sp. HXWNR29]MCU4188720.1 hypothetical protein [Flavobacterium sp. HXWNR29]
MSDFKLRTESIKDDEIINLAVKNANDKKIIKALKSPEPCLIEGSRGTGKSFLMKIAQIDIDNKDDKLLSVFISFNISSLINTSDSLQFYHWMLAKTLRALLNKLRKKGLYISDYSKSLLSNDSSEDEQTIENNLKSIVELFENSYKNNKSINISTLPDIEDVKEAIKEICEVNKLERVYFFFDEAAHVFRPEQQRQFFNLFKDLRSPFITCNAAIYPGVTHFGDSFEPIHDCIYEVLDRNISESDYLDYFKKMVFKQADLGLKKNINEQINLFNTLALSCGGNPRILLKTLQDMSKFNTSEANKVIKDFYRIKIWSEHTELGEKYKGHQILIDWGRDFLEKTVIPTIVLNEKSSIYFWVNKDVPEAVKESLRLLTYTGIIKKIDSSVRSHGSLGVRYEVKYGCIISLDANPHNISNELFKIRSIRQFTAFGKNHSEYEKIQNLSASILEDDQYKASLESMLNKTIDVLSLTNFQKERLFSANINTIGDLYGLKESDLIEKIYNVGPSRARIMMNAANSELLEYISG